MLIGRSLSQVLAYVHVRLRALRIMGEGVKGEVEGWAEEEEGWRGGMEEAGEGKEKGGRRTGGGLE